MNQKLESKLANALFAEARADMRKISDAFGAAHSVGLPVSPMADTAVSVVLDSFVRLYGGLWVGGRATLYDDRFVFEPNAMNRYLHENGEALRFDVPLREIDTVQSRFGFLTGIIDIGVAGGLVSVRCYGAKKFAESIRTAMMEAASA